MDRFELAKKANKFSRWWIETDPVRVQDWFMLAWARDIPDLLSMPEGTTLNLGAGNRQIGDSIPLDLEHGWNAETDNLPYDGETISGIWAHGFFEHLTPETAITLLKECQRVLVTGGVLNIVTPHALCELQQEDLEHLSFWHEQSIPNLIRNPYFEREFEWKLKVHATLILGVVWRNMALMTQLVKEN